MNDTHDLQALLSYGAKGAHDPSRRQGQQFMHYLWHDARIVRYLWDKKKFQEADVSEQ